MTWKRSEIRQARQTPLKPLLEQLGYRLHPIAHNNYLVLGHGLTKEIILKDHYWHCLDDGSAGNAIDFLVKVHRISFRKAMELLCAS